MSNFYPLEVVGRGTDTQLQVGKHYIFGSVTYRFEGYKRTQYCLIPHPSRFETKTQCNGVNNQMSRQ